LDEAKYASRTVSIPFEVDYSMQRFIESEIELQNVLLKLIEDLSGREDFNAANIYCLI